MNYLLQLQMNHIILEHIDVLIIIIMLLHRLVYNIIRIYMKEIKVFILSKFNKK